jgi:hypothetical protein
MHRALDETARVELSEAKLGLVRRGRAKARPRRVRFCVHQGSSGGGGERGIASALVAKRIEDAPDDVGLGNDGSNAKPAIASLARPRRMCDRATWPMEFGTSRRRSGLRGAL